MKKVIIILVGVIVSLFVSAIIVSSVRNSQIDTLFEKYRNTGIQHAQIEIIYNSCDHDIYCTEAYILEHLDK